MTQRRDLILLILFLLLGTALRFYGLSEMQTILHSDEAYYGLDALSLVENPRLQAYFPANTGREGLWMNLLAPMVARLGATPLALRITSALVGITTLAAMYWLAREVYGKGAIWSVGALAVLYWHVHLSHIGFRVITMMLFGALGFATLLRARRIRRGWWLAGILIGLTLYTYIAARVYVGYAGLWLLWWAFRDKQQRRGIALTILIIGIMAIPLLIALASPSDTVASLDRAAASDLGQVWDNLANWANAWLGQGDENATHNLPNRPVLDSALAILALCGFVGAWQAIREKWMIIWWLGLVFVSLLPTILSINTPHFLRGAGLIIPLVLLLGAGGILLSRWRYTWLLPFLLISWSGWQTYTDFGMWLATETDDFGISYDYRINEAMFILDAETPPEQAIIMPTDDGFRATATYLAAGMQRDLTFYRWTSNDCYLSPRAPYTVLDLPIVLNSFAARVLPYVDDLQAIYAHPDNDYNIFTVTPSDVLSASWNAPQYGEALSAQVIAPTLSTVTAGDNLIVHWAMRFTAELPRNDYRVLLHLQGDPTPYDGGILYSTGDEPLCELAYTPQALQDVTIIQQLILPIPADLEAGEYHLAMGFYTPDDFTRLPVSPSENPHDYVNAWQLEVTE
ncbi:MAG: hypothetical protein WBC91_14885 [Phototrophicaceae bacterium]